MYVKFVIIFMHSVLSAIKNKEYRVACVVAAQGLQRYFGVTFILIDNHIKSI